MQDSKKHSDWLRSLQVPQQAAEGFTAAIEAVEKCERSFEPQFTAFLDPEARLHSAKYFSQSDCNFKFFGGYEEAEYQILGVFPAHSEPTLEAFPLIALEVSYQEQFGKLEHKDVLGTLMSLGIERKVFGDILVHEGRVYFFALSHMARYLMDHLEKIKRQGVKVAQVALENVPIPSLDKRPICVSVSTLRLDAIVASVFNMSRSQAQECIRQGYVKVDYVVVDKVDGGIQTGQMISVRRRGRFWVGDVPGLSKKGKLRLNGWLTQV